MAMMLADSVDSVAQNRRRGACPSLAMPMPTGDGLLARLRPESGVFTPAALTALARAADEFGNGILEITARGSVQIRGLRPDTVEPFAERLDQAGIVVATGVGIEISPLAGMDAAEVIDVRALRTALIKASRDLAPHLAPKISVVIDGGGVIPLGALKADIRLMAQSDRRFWLFGGDTFFGTIASSDACDVVMALLEKLAALGPLARGKQLSAADLPADLVYDTAVPPSLSDRHGPGVVGRQTVALGLPFGQVDARTLVALIEAATAMGVKDFRPAPHRTILLTGLRHEEASALCAIADALGFLTATDDNRQHIAACAGKGRCASGYFETRIVAEKIAGLTGFGDANIHISGCAKGCAQPQEATLTLVGQPGGIGIAFDTTADKAPEILLPNREIAPAMARLAALYRDNRHSGESAAEVLSRLGPAVLREIAAGERDDGN